MKTLKCMKTSMDGSHWGLSDWYPKIEAGIYDALSGPGDWTTGWYSSKKEIASACIPRAGNKIKVEVSVSDDFDTPGYCDWTVKPADTVGETVDRIRDGINQAWEEAVTDQKTNRTWAMWSIHNPDGAWVETYLRDMSEWGDDSPPGDEYHDWGWQGEEEDIPAGIKERLEEAMVDGSELIEVEGWTAKMVD